MSRISAQMGDLRRAVQQCEQIKQRLQQQELQMKTIYGRLHDWRGQSAEKLTSKMETFLQRTPTHIQELDMHKEQLLRYIHKMEEADRQFINY